MFTKNEILPLLEQSTLKRIVREFNIESDLRSVPSMIKSLHKSKAFNVGDLLLRLSKTDQVIIASHYTIPLDEHQSVHTAIITYSWRQRDAQELLEFYKHAYHQNFELRIEKSGRGIVLANDESQAFLLYPAEIRKLLHALRKVDKLRGTGKDWNDSILFHKNEFAIHELTTRFVLNKKRLLCEDAPYKDTELLLMYSYEPYRCIVLTLKDLANGGIISRVAFKILALSEVIQRLEFVLSKPVH